jgi:DNA-directed RNA polymerase
VTFDPENPTALQLREMDLEAEMMTNGADAYRSRILKARQRGEASTEGAAAGIVRRSVTALSASVEALVAHAASGAPGRRHVAIGLLNGVDPDMVAFLTIAQVVNSVAIVGSPSPAVQWVGKMIADKIEDEVRLAAFAKTSEHAGLLQYVLTEANARTKSQARKRTTLVYLLNKKGDTWKDWSDVQKGHLGEVLVNLCLAAVPTLAERVTVRVRRNDSRTVLRPTAETAAFLADRDEKGALLCPRYMPMVCPPVPWTEPRSGGYLVGKLGAVPLIKPRPGARRPRKVTLEKAPAVYAAVNAVQATPWRVNKWLYGHMLHAWESKVGQEHGLLPRQWDNKEEEVKALLPPKPTDIDDNPAARSRWRSEAHAVHLAASKGLSKFLQIQEVLSLAGKFLKEEAIYFPHNLDFRGRLYAIPLFLQPQGPDPARALLEFAEGREIGKGFGGRWLTVHGANTFGYDKVSLLDRTKWVIDHEAKIVKAAEDPWADLWWTEADKPWGFLAWCHEYAAWLREGPSFESRIPIALDGSCNGLQHYSAMLRDPVGGAAVNLVPAAEPNDIYGEVAKVVMRRLKNTVYDWGDVRAKYQAGWYVWGIDRTITKRPVMVLPYGGTERSCRVYVEEAYRKRVAEGAADPFTPEERKDALKLLAETVWASIGDVVVAARAAMDWLRAVARLMSSAGLDIRWNAPSGFPVLQDYRDYRSRIIKTRLNGSVTKLTLTEETDKLDAKRQANGLPPNFVHSLDAAALCLTVGQATAEGISSFAMIHDSYGTHAADTEKLSRLIREAFVEMYEGSDPLSELDREVRRVLPAPLHDRIPPLPERGELDLRSVLGSDFFFA